MGSSLKKDLRRWRKKTKKAAKKTYNIVNGAQAETVRFLNSESPSGDTWKEDLMDLGAVAVSRVMADQFTEFGKPLPQRTSTARRYKFRKGDIDPVFKEGDFVEKGDSYKLYNKIAKRTERAYKKYPNLSPALEVGGLLAGPASAGAAVKVGRATKAFGFRKRTARRGAGMLREALFGPTKKRRRRRKRR